MEIREILRIAEARLREAGCPDPKRDAEELMCHMMDFDRSRFFMKLGDVLSENGCENYFQLIDLRATRKPLQYIVGSQEFMGLNFKVDPSVLIPRQDTETLVEAALEHMKSGAPLGGWRVLDVGTGSGAIAVSICAKESAARAMASDISPEALGLAAANAAAAGVSSRVKFVLSDMFDGLGTGGRFHFVLSNPPYVKRQDLPFLQEEVSGHEPAIALDGGVDGLDFYRILARDAARRLKKRGRILLEIGFDQAEQVRELFEETGRYEEFAVKKDLAGHDRVFSALLKA